MKIDLKKTSYQWRHQHAILQEQRKSLQGND